MGVAVTLLLGVGGLGLILNSILPGDHARAVTDPHRPLAVGKPIITPTAPQVFERMTPEQAVEANMKVPIIAGVNPAASPFKLLTANQTDHARALTCLTMAIYYEAGNQGDEGEAAVAQVVLNRERNPMFPKTVCGVVFQGSNLPTGCQFTFTCDGSLRRRPNVAMWKHASEIAERALNGYVETAVGEATHYHTIWVVPYWQTSVVKVAQIGAHVFYRWKGDIGRTGLSNAAYAGNEPAPPSLDGVDPSLPAPVQLAEAHKPAPPPAIVVAENETPTAVLAPPAQELATQTVKPAALLKGDLLPPQQPGYFGHAANGPQRLPMPARW